MVHIYGACMRCVAHGGNAVHGLMVGLGEMLHVFGAIWVKKMPKIAKIC